MRAYPGVTDMSIKDTLFFWRRRKDKEVTPAPAPLTLPQPTHAPTVPAPRTHLTPLTFDPLPDIPAEDLAVDLPFRVAVIDTETTGLSGTARIVSWAVLHTGGEAPPTLHQGLINTDVSIPGGAETVHGISNKWMRAHGVEPHLGIKEFCSLLPPTGDKTPIAGQKVDFDLSLLAKEAARYDCPFPALDGGVLDTMHLGYDLLNQRRNCTLDDLYARYAVDLPPAWRHTAAGDVLGVARVLESMWRTPRLSGLGLGGLRRNKQKYGTYLRVPR